MKKVLLYALTTGFGGIEQYLMNIIRYKKEPQKIYGMIILGTNSPYLEELKQHGVDVFFLRDKYIKVYSVLKQCRKDYDAIYFNTSAIVNPLPYYYAKKLGYKIIIHSHSSYLPGPRQYLHYINRGIVVNKAKRFACSDLAAKWMFQERNYEFIPNAIDLDKYKYNPEMRTIIRNKYDISDNDIVLGYVARLTESKNHLFLLKVMEQIINKGHTNYKLMMVGDGEERQKLEEITDNIGIKDYVVFCGETRDANYYYSSFDQYVMPSLFEGFPLTVIEAQAAGLKCVISNTITQNVNVVGDIVYLPIECNYDQWADTIVNCDIVRNNNIDILREKGFDVHDFSRYIYNKISGE